MIQRRRAVVLAAAVTVVAACTSQGSPSPEPGSQGPSAAASSSSEPAASFVSDARTLRTIAGTPMASSQLTVGAEVGRNDVYTSHAATYTSDGLTISAVLHQPLAPGPHPGVVLVHGFVDPASYVSGGELQREQDYLARGRYVVLVPDLRGLAGSDPAPVGPPDLDMGSTVDVFNAISALATSALVGLDGERIGLMGHSLGGELVLNVLAANPGFVDAAVVFAPSSTDAWANVQQFLAPGDPFYQEIVAAYGTPETNATYWADISAATFVSQVSEPLLVVHGDADADVPFEWSQDLAASWQAAGKDVEFLTLPGENHVFEARWNEAMDAVKAFFSRKLQ